MHLKRLKYFIFTTLSVLLFALPVFSAETTLQGKIMKVTDGDTVVITPIEGGAFFKCRLYGIDAPETAKYGRRGRLLKPGQPYGEEASIELKKLILGQAVGVTLTGAKTYKREVCLIYKDGMDVNLEMTKWAMHGLTGIICIGLALRSILTQRPRPVRSA